MIRMQISLEERTYKNAKAVAQRQGISLAALCRCSLEETLAREPATKPWMAYAGILDGHPGDSTTVDSVAYDREKP